MCGACFSCRCCDHNTTQVRNTAGIAYARHIFGEDFNLFYGKTLMHSSLKMGFPIHVTELSDSFNTGL